jgi:hypothetical protein
MGDNQDNPANGCAKVVEILTAMRQAMDATA